jgi:hypothetical protein
VKITDYGSLAVAAYSDVLVIVDVDQDAMSSAGTTFQITVGKLLQTITQAGNQLDDGSGNANFAGNVNFNGHQLNNSWLNGIVTSVTTVTTTYTAGTGDVLIEANATAAPFTITLPSSPVTGKLYIVKKTDSSGNELTIMPGAGTFDGWTSIGLFNQYDWVAVQWDGGNWRFVGGTNFPGHFYAAGGIATSGGLTSAHNTLDDGSGNAALTGALTIANAVVPLNANPTFESGVSPWTGVNGATISQSADWSWKGTYSCKVVPNGSTANPCPLSEHISVAPSSAYSASGMLYCPTGYTSAQVNVDWYTSGGAYISTASGVPFAVPAGVPVPAILLNAISPSNAASGLLYCDLNGTPSSSTAFYVDEFALYAGATTNAGKVLRSDGISTFLSELLGADVGGGSPVFPGSPSVLGSLTVTGNGSSSLGHWYGAIVTNDITVQPNSSLSGSASMFLDNNNPAPVNQAGHAAYDTTVTAFATASEIPSVLNCLALAAATFGSNGNTLSGVSSGWTNDITQDSGYHGIFAAHRNSLTSDTSTAVSNTFTLGTASQGVTEIVLIAPSVGGSPSIVQSASQAIVNTNPVTMTLASTPTAGNLLVAFVAISTFDTGNSITTPAGWTLADSVADTYFEMMYVFTRIVQPGDGKTWTFSQTVPGDWNSGALYEIQQAETVPQVFEFFCNSGGTFGVYDKTYSVQPFSIDRNSAGGALQIFNYGAVQVGVGFRAAQWANFEGAVQFSRTAVTHTTSPHSASNTADYIIGCDPSGGAITVNLPALGYDAQTFLVVDETGSAGTNNITVNAPAGHTINGASSVVISTNYGAVRVYSNGNNYNAW